MYRHHAILNTTYIGGRKKDFRFTSQRDAHEGQQLRVQALDSTPSTSSGRVARLVLYGAKYISLSRAHSGLET